MIADYLAQILSVLSAMTRHNVCEVTTDAVRGLGASLEGKGAGSEYPKIKGARFFSNPRIERVRLMCGRVRIFRYQSFPYQLTMISTLPKTNHDRR